MTPFQATVPLVLDGVGVMPGHYVSADSSGAVVIPDGQIEEVPAEARKVEAADPASRDQIAREQVGVNDRPPPAAPRSADRRPGSAFEAELLDEPLGLAGPLGVVRLGP